MSVMLKVTQITLMLVGVKTIIWGADAPWHKKATERRRSLENTKRN